MFGLGMGEIIVIVVVALLVLGPDKLPDAAKSLSKGIRDFRKHSKDLQQSLEDDNEIGGAIRDIKSALRGEELRPYVPPHIAEQPGADELEHDPDEPFSPAELEEGAGDGVGAAPDGPSAEAEGDLEPTAASGHRPPGGAEREPGAEGDRDSEEPPLIRPAEGAVSRTRKVRARPAPEAGPDKSHG